MSDRMTAEIAIGGPIPSALVDDLIQAIQTDSIYLTAEEKTFDPQSAEDVLRAARNGDQPGPLRLLDHEVSGGEFDVLEAFLISNNIPFDRWTDGIYEFDPELVQFRPGKDVRVNFTFKNKKPVIDRYNVSLVHRALQEGRADDALTTLDLLLGPDIPDLEPLSIVDTPLIQRKEHDGHLHRHYVEQ